MNFKELVNEIKQNKKVLKIMWVITLILFIVMFARYMKYKPMKLCYNTGLLYFKAGEYELAEDYFQSAIWEEHTKRQECNIRINKALSITTPITPESVTEENFDDSIKRLEEARDFLTENDCAHKDDTAGHNRKAQKLKDEIDEYIELLKEQNKKSKEDKKEDDGSSDTDKQKAEEEEQRKQNEKQAQLKETFNKIEQEGLSERNETLELYNAWNMDISFGDKTW